VLLSNEQCQFKRLTATGIVRTGSGLFNGFLVASGTPTVKIYDGVDNTGAVILNTMQTAAATPYPVPVLVNVGVYVEIGGSGDITFFYN
jgi:hypothetical protein